MKTENFVDRVQKWKRQRLCINKNIKITTKYARKNIISLKIELKKRKKRNKKYNAQYLSSKVPFNNGEK